MGAYQLRPGRIAVAVSGGVDSLGALLLLRGAGYDVFALHGIFTEDDSVAAGLEAICAELGVEFYLADLRGVFAEKIAGGFARSWLDGLTPNPCALCNRDIKFGALFDRARNLGCDFFATGHYARIINHPIYMRKTLAPAKDGLKDQGYFLSLLPRDKLSRILFPLADCAKEECRRLAAAHGVVPPSRKESQDICFISKGESQAEFVENWAERRGIDPGSAGPIKILADTETENSRPAPAGSHRGLFRYTIGQRKGLGIPHTEPLYLIAKDKRENSLTLAPASAMAQKSCVIGQVNYFVEPEKWPARLRSRLRYRQKAAETSAAISGCKISLEFAEPQFPAAAGQIATVEDTDGIILAAGVIEKIGLGRGK